MKAVTALALFVALAAANPLFDQWALKNHKAYTAGEYMRRVAIFEENRASLPSLRAEHPQAQFGLTQFADLTFEEFVQKHTGVRPPAFGARLSTVPKVNVPDSFDWRDADPPRLNPVTNQGSCGSCWAFASAAYLEGYHAKDFPIVKLSEQQLVHCDHECQVPGDDTSCDKGCLGGWMTTAETYAIKNGMMTEKDYPYKGWGGECQYDAAKVEAVFNGTSYMLPEGDEEALLNRAYSDGPISIAVNANLAWQLYFGGVLTGSCHNKPENLNHGVTLVGWGYDSDKSVDFWTIRNSWGPAWGEKGHIRIQRGINQCGVANAATVIDP